ncbi:MAG: response regulator transcription factor, partial [Rhodocyclaceae bacterium]|nr:response regulator transcription factor [Rhodocyclaceae bacterium]
MTMSAVRKTRVMIIDDYPVVAADLRTMLELVEGVEVVGDVTCSLHNLHQSACAQPDIILLDLDMDRRKSPQADGQTVVSKVSRQWPGAAIYVLTA